ncbi:MAG: hypothetical protein JWR24_1708 [Actinoallomurus sp.]|nr:hypothetical protein [Actinoallomurus sp.]
MPAPHGAAPGVASSPGDPAEDVAAVWPVIGRRPAATGFWQASRTVAFAGLADPGPPVEITDGLCGALADGSAWRFHDGSLRGSGA